MKLHGNRRQFIDNSSQHQVYEFVRQGTVVTIGNLLCPRRSQPPWHRPKLLELTLLKSSSPHQLVAKVADLPLNPFSPTLPTSCYLRLSHLISSRPVTKIRRGTKHNSHVQHMLPAKSIGQCLLDHPEVHHRPAECN